MPTRTISAEVITSKIFIVRGQKVMLDKDLAVLYQVKPIALRQQVSRNKERFPVDFCFKLNDSEVDSLVSQFVIPSKQILGGYNPYVFTEQGIAMLSSVLRSRRAVLVNISIMRAFVKLREILSTHKNWARKLEDLEKKYDAQFRIVFEAIHQLIVEEEKPKGKIGF
ncbi:MAG: ORF6N domain-containing protein [Candidatus Omnitrophica bacterium]|nr:ORF6N domain-containing protein [Candidatus Omnitrophota bacterium]